jgi:hypothetical protein
MGTPKYIETLNAFGTVVAAAAATVGLVVAIMALYRPESLQKQKDLQALAAARNLAFFAHRENLEEFRLAATGQHVGDSGRFDTVIIGLQAIKFDQIPPHLTEAFISIWAQTQRAKKMSEEHKAVSSNLDGEIELAKALLRPIDQELVRSGAFFDADCKAVLEQTPSKETDCARFR